MFADDLDDALFLDIDGALLEIAPTPDSVRVPRELIELLYRLSVVLDGAIALVSGRPVDDVDRLFRPYRFATLGVHGCERRGVDGELRLPSVDARAINLLHDECCGFVGDSPDLMAEYKPCGVAIHYRLAPERADSVRRYLEGLVHHAGPAFSIIEGQHVCEIKPAVYSRAAAIHEMLTLLPFRGRRPIFIGGNLAQDAFEAVNVAGGLAIEVGTDGPTAATLRIANVASVHEALEILLEELARSRTSLH
jgi:trehalose 6-phosphate phosphatase